MATCNTSKTTPVFVARKQIDAAKPITFTITPDHIKNAKCGDPTKCVVAQALGERFGDFFDGMHVGGTITKIVTGDKVIRFATPSKLRRQIPVFDKTGHWNLPLGEYTLQPPQGVKKLGGNPRWEHKKKKRTGVQDVFKARNLPSRRVIRVETLAKMAVV